MGRESHYNPDQLSEAIRLSKQGWTHQRIAELQEVSRETVTRHLGTYHRALAQELLADGVAEIAQQIELLKQAVEELIEEWQRSRKDAEVIQSKSKGKPPANEAEAAIDKALAAILEESTRVAGRYGDPRIRAEVRATLADIRDLIGIESLAASRKIAETDAVEQPRIVIPDRDDRFDAESSAGPVE